MGVSAIVYSDDFDVIFYFGNNGDPVNMIDLLSKVVKKYEVYPLYERITYIENELSDLADDVITSLDGVYYDYSYYLRIDERFMVIILPYDEELFKYLSSVFKEPTYEVIRSYVDNRDVIKVRFWY